MATNEQPVKIKGDTSTIVEYEGENFKILKKESFNELDYEAKIEATFGIDEQVGEYAKHRQISATGVISHEEELKDGDNSISFSTAITSDRVVSNIVQALKFEENVIETGSVSYGLMGSNHTFLNIISTASDGVGSLNLEVSALQGARLTLDDKNVVRSVNGVLADESGELPLELNVLTSADGTKFKLMVSNEGFLGVQKIQ
ncbi:hypothetical protein [Myroides profundi]|uniref:Uncharacterized protein n=1 Tax=Myroides profundi TaxID=480520 RepID=A0AAJ5BDT8_MYRPR|nr:hypothetical protein [Myroides profundi]AJH16665.1 hypothetical protein MPR_3553 [Myroides profundi]SEQ78306.1 hypothetical protein SAMN04488089_10627 [Myroides profundi]